MRVTHARTNTAYLVTGAVKIQTNQICNLGLRRSQDAPLVPVAGAVERALRLIGEGVPRANLLRCIVTSQLIYKAREAWTESAVPIGHERFGKNPVKICARAPSTGLDEHLWVTIQTLATLLVP